MTPNQRVTRSGHHLLLLGLEDRHLLPLGLLGHHPLRLIGQARHNLVSAHVFLVLVLRIEELPTILAIHLERSLDDSTFEQRTIKLF